MCACLQDTFEFFNFHELADVSPTIYIFIEGCLSSRKNPDNCRVFKKKKREKHVANFGLGGSDKLRIVLLFDGFVGYRVTFGNCTRHHTNAETNRVHSYRAIGAVLLRSSAQM